MTGETRKEKAHRERAREPDATRPRLDFVGYCRPGIAEASHTDSSSFRCSSLPTTTTLPSRSVRPTECLSGVRMPLLDVSRCVEPVSTSEIGRMVERMTGWTSAVFSCEPLKDCLADPHHHFFHRLKHGFREKQRFASFILIVSESQRN